MAPQERGLPPSRHPRTARRHWVELVLLLACCWRSPHVQPTTCHQAPRAPGEARACLQAAGAGKVRLGWRRRRRRLAASSCLAAYKAALGWLSSDPFTVTCN